MVSSVQPKVSQPSPQPPWNYGAKGGSPSPYRLDVSKSSLNVNGLIVKMLGNISRNLILMIIVPRCPNELAELREGAFRCGGGGDPVYLSQTPTFLNYRQGDDDDNL